MSCSLLHLWISLGTILVFTLISVFFTHRMEKYRREAKELLSRAVRIRNEVRKQLDLPPTHLKLVKPLSKAEKHVDGRAV